MILKPSFTPCRLSIHHSTTSQWPPYLGPTRRIALPSFSFWRCHLIPSDDNPISRDKADLETFGFALIIAKILSHYYSNNTEDKVLAAQYGISRQTIYNWTKGKRRPSIIVPATTRPAPNWRDVRILKMQLEREKRIRKILQCANAALNSSINARLNAMEGLYKEDPVKYNIHILCDAFGVTRRLFYGHIKYNKRDNAWFKTGHSHSSGGR